MISIFKIQAKMMCNIFLVDLESCGNPYSTFKLVTIVGPHQ